MKSHLKFLILFIFFSAISFAQNNKEVALKKGSEAIKLMDAGKIEESIMIGDNLNADILGAKNAGMDSIFVNHIHVDCNQEPTYIIHHLKELETIL